MPSDEGEVLDKPVPGRSRPPGGIVGQLNVREGQRVSAGDIVVLLDNTQTRMNLGLAMNGYTASRARAASGLYRPI